jgi:hypothetical protein
VAADGEEEIVDVVAQVDRAEVLAVGGHPPVRGVHPALAHRAGPVGLEQQAVDPLGEALGSIEVEVAREPQYRPVPS